MAMSRYEYLECRIDKRGRIVELNRLGAEGWKLVFVLGSKFYFIRETKEAVK